MELHTETSLYTVYEDGEKWVSTPTHPFFSSDNTDARIQAFYFTGWQLGTPLRYVRDTVARYFPQSAAFFMNFDLPLHLPLTWRTTDENIGRLHHIFTTIMGWSNEVEKTFHDLLTEDEYSAIGYMLTVSHAQHNRDPNESIFETAARGHIGWSVAMLCYLERKIEESEDKEGLLAKRRRQFVPFADLSDYDKLLDTIIILIADYLAEEKTNDEIIQLIDIDELKTEISKL